MMNYLEYFDIGGQVFPIPDTIQGKNYLIKREPGKLINSSFFSKNNLKYVGDKLIKANNTLGTKIASINGILNSFANRLDIALGILHNSNSLYLDSNWDVNRLASNLSRP